MSLLTTYFCSFEIDLLYQVLVLPLVSTSVGIRASQSSSLSPSSFSYPVRHLFLKFFAEFYWNWLCICFVLIFYLLCYWLAHQRVFAYANHDEGEGNIPFNYSSLLALSLRQRNVSTACFTCVTLDAYERPLSWSRTTPCVSSSCLFFFHGPM